MRSKLSQPLTSGAPFSDSTTGGDVFTLSVVTAGTTTTPPPNNGGSGQGNGNEGGTTGGTTGNPGPSAVPLPAASWQALAGLAGLGLIAATKKLVKRPARD